MEHPGSTHRDWEALAGGILQDHVLPRISNSSRLRASLVSKKWLRACSTKVVKKPGTCFLELYRRACDGHIFDNVQIHSPVHGEWYSGERVCWIGERSFECDGRALQGGENGLVFVWRWPADGARQRCRGIEVVVYNPISDARRELPLLEDAMCPDFLQMVPRAAQGGKEYSIAAVRGGLDRVGLAIFNSWTGSWHWCQARPAVARELEIRRTMFWTEGKMLCLFGAASGRPPWTVKNPSIWSFDLEEEEWTMIGTVPDKLLMPFKDCLNLKLVGGNGRVLLVITKGYCQQQPQVPDDDDDEEESDDEEDEEDEEEEDDDDEEGGRKKVKYFKYLGHVMSVEVWELLHFDSTMPAWVCLSTMPDEYVEFMGGAFEMECNSINQDTVWRKNSFHSITILDAEGCIYFCFDSRGHCNRLLQFDSIEKSWHWLDRCPQEMPDSYQLPRISLFTMKPNEAAKS